MINILMILLVILELFISKPQAQEIERCREALEKIRPKDAPEETFLWNLRDAPVATYGKLEKQGQPSFMPHSEPFLLKVIGRLNTKIADGAVLSRPEFTEYRTRLTHLRDRAITLLEEGIPGKPLKRWVVEYAETFDELLSSRDPELKTHYHRDFAKGVLEQVLKEGDGTHLFFTSEPVDDIYFWHIRPTATYLLWLPDLPDFAANASNYSGDPLLPTDVAQQYLDGLWLGIEEVLKHDIGHTFYMKRQDAYLFESLGRPREELVAEWTRIKDIVYQEWKRLEASDQELATSARYLISEIIHERGYQYFPPILRQQLQSDKWAQILSFKKGNNYWGDEVFNERHLRRSPEAQAWFLELVNRLIREENHRAIRKTEDNPISLKRWHKIETYHGTPIRVKPHSRHDIEVVFHVPGVGEVTTSLYEIKLVLAPTSEKNLLTRERIPNLDDLTPVETYKLERLLHMMDEGRSTAFTKTRKPDEYRGVVKEFDSDRDEITFQDEIGRIHRFPFLDISFQPIRPNEVTIEHKYINKDASARFVPTETLRSSYERYRESVNSDGPPYVVLEKKYTDRESGETKILKFELGMVDTRNLVMAKAVSSLLTRSLEDAKDINGGYLPPSVVERVQTELISPYGVTHLWGSMGRRFVLSRDLGNGTSEIVGSLLAGESRDNLFFFTSRYNNLKVRDLEESLDFSETADGNPEHRWFDKFSFPEVQRYKPKGFHHLANYVIEREGVRGMGLARLMLEGVVRHYSRTYLLLSGKRPVHSQRLLCGKGFWQIGDPPWLHRMGSLGFFPRLGADTFHIDVPWAPLIPTYDSEGQMRLHVPYNRSFGIPQIYEDLLAGEDSPYRDLYEAALKAEEDGTELEWQPLLDRIPEVIEVANSGTAKIQYIQLMYSFTDFFKQGSLRRETHGSRSR